MWVEIKTNGNPPESGFWQGMNKPMLNEADKTLYYYRDDLGWRECSTFNKPNLDPTHYWSEMFSKIQCRLLYK